MWSTLLLSLLLAAGETPDAGAAPASAAPADAAGTPVAGDVAGAPAEVTPPAPTRVDVATEPKRLPDGFFVGVLEGAGPDVHMQLTVVGGLVTRFVVQRPGASRMPLNPNAAPHDVGLRFGGRADGSYLKVSGAFIDAERALGQFEGTLDKQRVRGTWRLARR
jgi:hypothetical protein